MPLGQIVVALLDAQSARLRRPLNIVETGTMFVTELEPGEKDLMARSTYAVTSWLAENPPRGNFASIDLDRGHINACRETLGRLADYVTHYEGKAADVLAGYIKSKTPDFVLLDADSDADEIQKEYNIIAPVVEHTGGIIVIDDVFKRHDVNKGRKVLPALERAGKRWYPLGGIAAGIPFGADAEKILQELSRHVR